jgi:hypothetical protein
LESDAGTTTDGESAITTPSTMTRSAPALRAASHTLASERLRCRRDAGTDVDQFVIRFVNDAGAILATFRWHPGSIDRSGNACAQFVVGFGDELDNSMNVVVKTCEQSALGGRGTGV